MHNDTLGIPMLWHDKRAQDKYILVFFFSFFPFLLRCYRSRFHLLGRPPTLVARHRPFLTHSLPSTSQRARKSMPTDPAQSPRFSTASIAPFPRSARSLRHGIARWRIFNLRQRPSTYWVPATTTKVSPLPRSMHSRWVYRGSCQTPSIFFFLMDDSRMSNSCNPDSSV